MSNLIVMSLVVVLVLLLVLITLYLFGYFNVTPADLPPFSDIKYAIEPSVLKQAKEDYNKIVDTVFNVLNSQTDVLDNSAFESKNGAPPPLIAAIEEELQPLLRSIAAKYTPAVAGKLIKYFACKHVKVLLDNYYIGPHIYFAVPDFPQFQIRAFPFIYNAKRRPGQKPRRASTLAPFKYFAKNIPDRIRPQVAGLYDDVLKRYMRAFNKAVAHLPELNVNTIKTIDMNKTLKKYGPMIAKDLDTIQKLFGANVSRTVKTILTHNVLPLLNRYYKGPAINYTIPLTVPTNPHIVLVNFPNTNENDIIKVVQGCPKNQVLQTTVIDKTKGIVVNECIFPTNRSLSNLSTKRIECPAGKSLQTTLIDSKKSVRVFECVDPVKAAQTGFGLPNFNMNGMASPSAPSYGGAVSSPQAPQMMAPTTMSSQMKMASPQMMNMQRQSQPILRMPPSSPAKPLTTTFSSPSSSSAVSSSSYRK